MRRCALRDKVIAKSLACETDIEHAKRHPRKVLDCARCVFASLSARCLKVYGSYAHESGGQTHRTTWLARRPAHRGGDWAIGCVFCAQHMARFHTARSAGAVGKAERKGSRFANTKWSRFEIRHPEQVAVRGIRQHAGTLQHRVATAAFFVPLDAARTVSVSTYLESSQQIFRGAVPQLADWLRAWRACATPQSFYAAEANGVTDNYIQGSRVQGASRKAFAAMIRCMALTLRARKARRLRSATCVGLALDDRASYRLIRFKCDVQDSSEMVNGILGVLYRGGDMPTKKLTGADDDYSRAMAESVVRCIEVIGTDQCTG